MGIAIASFLCVCILNSLHVSSIRHAALKAVSGQSGPKQDSQFVKPETIQGCYDLTLWPWRPDMKLGEDEEFITPTPSCSTLCQTGDGGLGEQRLCCPARAGNQTEHSPRRILVAYRTKIHRDSLDNGMQWFIHGAEDLRRRSTARQSLDFLGFWQKEANCRCCRASGGMREAIDCPSILA